MSDNTNVILNMSVVGNEPEVQEFIRLCQTIAGLGIQGASRGITVSVDGDGSGRLAFFDAIDAKPFPHLEGFDPDIKRHLEISIGE